MAIIEHLTYFSKAVLCLKDNQSPMKESREKLTAPERKLSAVEIGH